MFPHAVTRTTRSAAAGPVNAAHAPSTDRRASAPLTGPLGFGGASPTSRSHSCTSCCRGIGTPPHPRSRLPDCGLRRMFTLKPSGIYTISHLAEGPNAPPIYPLPWALTPEVSFLETPEKIFEILSSAGFVGIEDRAIRARSKPGGGPQPGTIGAAPAMGDDMPERTRNSAQSIQEGRLVAMMVVAKRPA